VRISTASAAASRLRTGQRIATVTLAGAAQPSTAAVAGGSLGGPTLGWRLDHLL
jgi:hypothetical protein